MRATRNSSNVIDCRNERGRETNGKLTSRVRHPFPYEQITRLTASLMACVALLAVLAAEAPVADIQSVTIAVATKELQHEQSTEGSQLDTTSAIDVPSHHPDMDPATNLDVSLSRRGCPATSSIPKLTFGLRVYVNACGSVWKAFYATTAAAGSATAIGGCALATARLKSPLIATLCDFGGDKALDWGIKLVKKVIKDKSLNPGLCYQAKFPGPGKLKKVAMKNCT